MSSGLTDHVWSLQQLVQAANRQAMQWSTFDSLAAFFTIGGLLSALMMWWGSYHPREMSDLFPPDTYDEQGKPRPMNEAECKRAREFSVVWGIMLVVAGVAVYLYGRAHP